MKEFYKKYILPRILNRGMQRVILEKERPEVAGAASGVVLEIGFGSGLNLPYFKEIKKLYALEPSFELYDLAKERMAGISFPVEYIQASAEKIPLPDNSIDSVVSAWSLCSISNPALALVEVKRVLKPDGKFVFIEHGKSPKKFYAFLQNIISPLLKNFVGECEMNRDMEKIIADSGLIITKLDKYPEEYKPLNYTYKGAAIKQ